VEQSIVESTIWIAAPRERVWQAITQPEQLTAWFAPGSTWEIPSLEIGRPAKFYNTPDDIALHTIQSLDPPHYFALSWEENGQPMLTSFTLEDENNGTRVTINESGFEQLPDEIRETRVEQTSAGYTMSLENLKAYLEGRSIPH
jgi:uncharacterized protein YndB with AHSA1/START domain